MHAGYVGACLLYQYTVFARNTQCAYMLARWRSQRSAGCELRPQTPSTPPPLQSAPCLSPSLARITSARPNRKLVRRDDGRGRRLRRDHMERESCVTR